MKRKIVLTLGVMIAVSSLYAQLAVVQPLSTIAYNLKVPVFGWESTVFDFGTIKAGQPAAHKFNFTNNGTETLVITSVNASCGCTVTDYSKDPIPAGGAGFVMATYDAAKVGAFTKTVTVYANTDEPAVQLTIKGEVVE